ncbi:hypothetical protein AB833_23470 [Chromatiales bacterium (ex Bugula neritina AB1)]|nr:hypothetical protein AB833_23470 [Chromatiales bacterium (ex Bugula neritina AB1)]
MLGTFVFFVGPASDTFVEEFHKPTDIIQALAPGIDKQIEMIAFSGLDALIVHIFMSYFCTGNELMCPSNNGLRFVGEAFVSTNMQDEV